MRRQKDNDMTTPKRMTTLCALVVCAGAQAQVQELRIPPGDLKTALDQYALQTGAQILYSADAVRGRVSPGVQGQPNAERALAMLLAGTGLAVRRDSSGALLVFRDGAAGGVGGTATAEAADDGKELSTVTVTAQKRAQSAQAVPIAMTALSAKTLDVQRVQNLQDVARLTPGLLVSAFSQANPTIAIRGISNTFSQIGVNKPVGVFVDDVFIPRNSAASFDLYDLDSIAILKGPQGTLFGRNVTGGAIVINTRKPDPSRQTTEGEVTVGNHGDRQLKALFNAPLNDRAAFSVSTSLRRRDGTGRDRLTGREQDDIDSKNVRAQALVRIAPDVTASFSADYSDDRNGGRTLSSDTLGDDGNVRTSELGVPQDYSRIISGASARLVWRLPAGEVTSITAYRKSHSTEDYAGVGASYTFLASGSQSITRDADRLHTFSQELRYASPKWTAGDFIAGLYYADEDGDRQLGTRGLAARTGALASFTVAAQSAATKSAAVFVDGTVHLPAALDLTLGIRYTHDRKSADLTRSDLVKPANSFTVDGLDHVWTKLTPRAVLSWTPRANLLAYLSATRGFTSGGYNADALTAAVFRAPFGPETVNNFELGIKSQWLDNRLRINASVYRMRYRDKQELVNNTLTGVLSIFNAGKASVDGGELELAYKPASWLDLGATYSHVDGRYDSFVLGAVNNTGNPLSNAPRSQYGASANISIPVPFGYLVGAASHAWKASYNTGAANDLNLQLPAYGLTNLSAGVESRDRVWRLLAWVKNASDTTYLLTRSTQVVRARYAGEPRTFGLSLAARF
jgi:iron complex outermembrane receptor protein